MADCKIEVGENIIANTDRHAKNTLDMSVRGSRPNRHFHKKH
jgi:hypothetical protein